MDEKKLARFLRLVTVQQLLEAENLTRKEALDLLMGPLTPDDNSTIVDDRSLLDIHLDEALFFLDAPTKLDIFQINVNEKYILAFPVFLSTSAKLFIRQSIKQWLESDDTVLVLDAGAKLVKVDVEQLKKDYQAAQKAG